MEILHQVLAELGIRKTQRAFLSKLLSMWLVIPGRINYANLSRYSEQSEQTFRNWFAKPCPHGLINTGIVGILQKAGCMGSTLILGGEEMPVL